MWVRILNILKNTKFMVLNSFGALMVLVKQPLKATIYR